MAQNPLPLNPPQTPWTDPRTGNVSEPWRRYLLALQNFLSQQIAQGDIWLSQDTPSIPNGVDLGALSSGHLSISVTDGYATPTSSATIPTSDLSGTISNAQLADMVQARIKGRASGAGTGPPQDLTGTQATVILDNMVGDSGSGGTKGLAPAPAAGDAAAGKYLKSDGTWTLPPGAGATGVNTTTSTGTVNDLDFSGASVLRCNNASDLTITGLVAGVDGQIVSVISVGAGNVYLSNENAGSSAANRLSNIVTSGVTPLAAGVGRATFVYVGTAQRWTLISHEQGTTINAVFTAGDFTANGTMTWTVQSGDIGVLNYKVSGAQLYVNFDIDTTTIGGVVNTTLLWLLPNGYTAGVPAAYNTIRVVNGGVVGTGMVRSGSSAFLGSSGTRLAFYLNSFGNWTAGANNSYVTGQITTTLA